MRIWAGTAPTCIYYNNNTIRISANHSKTVYDIYYDNIFLHIIALIYTTHRGDANVYLHASYAHCYTTC